LFSNGTFFTVPQIISHNRKLDYNQEQSLTAILMELFITRCVVDFDIVVSVSTLSSNLWDPLMPKSTVPYSFIEYSLTQVRCSARKSLDYYTVQLEL
jgi:hypothetical protein